MSTSTRTDPLSFLTDELNTLKQKGTHFKLRVLQDAQAAVCTFDGKQVINLASNNYLGLTTHPKLREAALEATRKYGVGSGAVRTIAGTMSLHMELEEKIARFKNVEACVVFQSGFTANAGTVSAILGKEDFIISDELNHASIIDGARLSRAKILVFRHKDVAHAEFSDRFQRRLAQLGMRGQPQVIVRCQVDHLLAVELCLGRAGRFQDAQALVSALGAPLFQLIV